MTFSMFLRVSDQKSRTKEAEKRCWTGKVKAEDGSVGEAAVGFFRPKGGPKTGYTPDLFLFFLFLQKVGILLGGQNPN